MVKHHTQKKLPSEIKNKMGYQIDPFFRFTFELFFEVMASTSNSSTTELGTASPFAINW